MDRSQDVFADHSFIENDCILIVVSLPWHISNKKVAPQRQLTIFGGIAFSKNVTGLHTLPFVADRTQVDDHVLVGATVLGNTVFLQSRLEADELFILCTVIQNADGRCINILNHAIALSRNHRTAILTDLFLDTCTHNRCFVVEQGNGLAHHVRTHQRTVSIIVFKERNQTGSNRSNLLRCNIHEVHFTGIDYGEVSILTAFHIRADESAIVVQRRITLTDNMLRLFFCCQIHHIVVVQVHHAILHLSVRS